MSLALAAATSPETREASTVIVPVGSVEQHGPHLPLDTDTVVAVAVAEGLAARLRIEQPGVWVAPAVAYGASGEHQAFPGTLSIGTEALRVLLVELARSLATWAGRVVFVNGHGGNVAALTTAVAQLVAEGHHASWAACATRHEPGTTPGSPPDLHAGRTETSLMLHLRPASVHLDLAEPGDRRALRELLPAMMTGGVAAVSANGVLGDPTGATAEEGRVVLAAMIDAAAQDH